jgi:hypothetical protein
MISQNQIQSLRFSTITLAESAGRLNEVCYVEETGLFYAYNNNCTRIRDGLFVLNTKNGGNTRWIATGSQLASGVYTVPTIGLNHGTRNGLKMVK